MELTLNKDIKAVINYQTNRDYNIDEPINFDELIGFLERVVVSIASKNKNYALNVNFNEFYNFKKKVVSIGSRTALENELKISAPEALNYLMGFPLNFNLDSFVELFDDTHIQHGSINHEDIQHVDSLRLNFDKKKKLISQNFESTTHIDVEEFLEWSENKGFITLK